MRFLTADQKQKRKATILPMEKSKLIMTERDETGDRQSQEHAHNSL
jgi:hypothetical protein